MKFARTFVAAIACIASLAFVAAVQADQVRFYYKSAEGVKPAPDIHYSVMDLNGNKVAEATETGVAEGVTINGLEDGSFFLSAEMPSTGYFGSQTITLPAEEEIPVVLGPDGLRHYDSAAANQQPATATQPSSSLPGPQPAEAVATGRPFIAALGIGGLVAGVVALATHNRSVSSVVE